MLTQACVQVTILSGSVVRVWGVLEQVLQRHEHALSKADRAMRITRVDLQQHGHEPLLIGVRYKDSLLPEARAPLHPAAPTAAQGGVCLRVLRFGPGLQALEIRRPRMPTSLQACGQHIAVRLA